MWDQGGNPVAKLVKRVAADVSDLVSFVANPMAVAGGSSTVSLSSECATFQVVKARF